VPAGPAVSAMAAPPRVRSCLHRLDRVGRRLLREAADQIISSSMELGGNAPFVGMPRCRSRCRRRGRDDREVRNGELRTAHRFYVHDSLVEVQPGSSRR